MIIAPVILERKMFIGSYNSNIFFNETTFIREDVNGALQNITAEVNNRHVASKTLVKKEFPTYGGPNKVNRVG